VITYRGDENIKHITFIHRQKTQDVVLVFERNKAGLKKLVKFCLNRPLLLFFNYISPHSS
jgi:hypothetical protein